MAERQAKSDLLRTAGRNVFIAAAKRARSAFGEEISLRLEGAESWPGLDGIG